MYHEDDMEQLLSDLNQLENDNKMLNREMEELERDCESITNELAYWNKFESWLEKVYPNAITEFNAICDIERGV